MAAYEKYWEEGKKNKIYTLGDIAIEGRMTLPGLPPVTIGQAIKAYGIIFVVFIITFFIMSNLYLMAISEVLIIGYFNFIWYVSHGRHEAGTTFMERLQKQGKAKKFETIHLF